MAKRRGNHEGSISKRSNGRWQAQLTMPDGSRRSAYAKTQTEARVKLKDLQAEAERASTMLITATYATIGDFLTAWLTMIEQTRKPNTYRFYRQNIMNYCQEITSIPPAKLAPSHVQKLLARRLDEGLAKTTVRHIYTTLHAALEFGMRQGVVESNIAKRVDRPRKGRYEYHTYSARQVQELLTVTATHRLAALFVLAVSTGMRPGEILGLRWQDVDFTAGDIHIHRNIQRVDGVTRSEDTKTESGRRRILLTESAFHALSKHKQQQDEEKAILENQWDHSWNLVFCTRKGKPINASWLTHRVYEPAIHQAGLPHIRFYDLRHTAATLLMEAGIHPKVVSEMLGHSSITLTLGTYTHVLPHMHAGAVQEMEKIIKMQKNTPASEMS